MLGYMMISFIRLGSKLKASVKIDNRVYICDEINTPFVAGVFSTKIYIPSSLAENDCRNVLLHENAHLKRKDHIWKLIAFLVLSFYWFNPVLWAAYILFGRDMELACDESVIRNLDIAEKKNYAQSLLDCSSRDTLFQVCPIAFGTAGVKERIKAIANYKKPGFWFVILVVVVCAGVSVCFLTNPSDKNKDVARDDQDKEKAIVAYQEMLKAETGAGSEAGAEYGEVTKVSAEQVEKLKAGMTREEVLSVLGDTKDIGSGLYIYEYQVDGKILKITFMGDGDKLKVSGKELLKELEASVIWEVKDEIYANEDNEGEWDIHYPKLEGVGAQECNKLIEEAIENMFSDVDMDQKVYANLEYKIRTQTEELISISFEGDVTVYGYHGYHEYFTINYDKINGRPIKLGDIVEQNDDLVNRCIEQIPTQCSKEFAEYYNDTGAYEDVSDEILKDDAAFFLEDGTVNILLIIPGNSCPSEYVSLDIINLPVKKSGI